MDPKKIMETCGTWRSCLNIKLGNIEKALEDLKKAIEINKETYTELAKRETYFDTVRGDSRFMTIVQGKL